MIKQISWEWLASQWSHGKRVYQRDGELYTLPMNVAPLYKGLEVALELCSGHGHARWLPGPECWKEIFRCLDCIALTQAANPEVDVVGMRVDLNVEMK